MMAYRQKYHKQHRFDESTATRFDESTDLSTTYLDRIDMTRDMIIKAEGNIPNFLTRVYKWKIAR